MRCPILDDLPPPPSGKTGWPWTIESPQLPDVMPNGKAWPRISIVTPSYNHGRFVEETIRSVLLQGYPDVEYIVMDGGSTDESCKLIEKYSPWLRHWQSEPDEGQVYALNLGFQKCSGDVLNWLNSDDFLFRNALAKIARAIELFPEAEVITGCRSECDVNGDVFLTDCAVLQMWPMYFLGVPNFPQDATFLSRSAFYSIFPFDERFNYFFDTAFYYMLLRNRRCIALIQSTVSGIRVYPEMKTLRTDVRKQDEERILRHEYVSKAIIMRFLTRMLRTRFSLIVFDLIRMYFRRSQHIRLIRFDPRCSEWKSYAVE